MKSVILVSLSFLLTLCCPAQQQPSGYEFHQAMAEATLPPFYRSVCDDIGVSKEQYDSIQKRLQYISTYMTQWVWLRAMEDDKSYVYALLEEKQKHRVEQLRIQYIGALHSLICPSVQQKISVNEPQADNIRRLFLEFHKKRAGVSWKDNADKFNASLHDSLAVVLINSYNERALRLLTPTQTVRFNRLRGKEFLLQPSRNWEFIGY